MSVSTGKMSHYALSLPQCYRSFQMGFQGMELVSSGGRGRDTMKAFLLLVLATVRFAS